VFPIFSDCPACSLPPAQVSLNINSFGGSGLIQRGTTHSNKHIDIDIDNGAMDESQLHVRGSSFWAPGTVTLEDCKHDQYLCHSPGLS
jgi:hypothetical protein